MSAASKPRVKATVEGVLIDPKSLVRRYRDALGDALSLLEAYGHRAEADEVAERYGLVYLTPKPEVRLSQSVPPAERLFDEHTR